MIHRIHGKSPVPESKFEKAQREARVTQPTTDRLEDLRRKIVNQRSRAVDDLRECGAMTPNRWQAGAWACRRPRGHEGGHGGYREARADRPPEPPSLSPLQREAEPPPVCSRCSRPITTLGDLYRCAQCHAAFDLACIKEHFGWSIGENPHPTLREAIAASMNDIGLGTTERIDRAEGRIRAALASSRPPEPPTLDVERLARAMHEAGTCENWSPGFGRLDANGDFHDDHGVAEHFHDARRVAPALGALPPPPDLSELRAALEWALAALTPFSHAPECSPTACVCGYEKARAALASQPPSTPREPS